MKIELTDEIRELLKELEDNIFSVMCSIDDEFSGAYYYAKQANLNLQELFRKLGENESE